MWWRPEPGGTGARRRREARGWCAGWRWRPQAREQAGELGPLEVSSYEAAIFLSVGEAWLRGVRGRGWLGLCREELTEGWREWGSGCELPARVGEGGEELEAEQGPCGGWRPCNPSADVEATERRRRRFPGEDGASQLLSTSLGAGSVLTP